MSHSANSEATLEAAIERAARKLAEEESQVVSDHPEPAQLIAYQEGGLDPAAAKRIRQHVVSCRDCSNELLGLASFDETAPEDQKPTSAETAAIWAKFQERLAERATAARVLEMPGRSPTTTQVPEPPATTTAQLSGAWQRWMLAASILLALSGLWLWIDGLSRRAPSPSDQLASLQPYGFDLLAEGEAVIRDAAVAQLVEVPPGMNALVPRLNLKDQTPHDTYRAEVLNPAGAVLWNQQDLQRQPAGHFTLLVSKALLPAGIYRARIVGISGEVETVLATYIFQLTYAS